MNLHLIPASDFGLVRNKYIEVIAHTPGIDRYARWSYGKHPSDKLLKAYMDNGEMYLLTDDANIAGMTAVVMSQGQDYETIPWAVSLSNDQVATLHLLAVCPDYQGNALGSFILDEAADLAVKNGRKALRLDTLQSNLLSQHMYEKAGFSYRGKQHLYAENTGWTDFFYYEKIFEIKPVII